MPSAKCLHLQLNKNRLRVFSDRSLLLFMKRLYARDCAVAFAGAVFSRLQKILTTIR